MHDARCQDLAAKEPLNQKPPNANRACTNCLSLESIIMVAFSVKILANQIPFMSSKVVSVCTSKRKSSKQKKGGVEAQKPGYFSAISIFTDKRREIFA